jgi:hypothetical protein
MGMLALRRKFEEWAEHNGYDITRDDKGLRYIYLDTQNAWIGFKAGHEMK